VCARQEELANLESNVAELDARGARLDAAAARTQEEASAKAAEQKEDKATAAALKKQHQTLVDESRRAGLRVSVHFAVPHSLRSISTTCSSIHRDN
jgi:septal ring factor EnvC (AmiA/AmiB activator)